METSTYDKLLDAAQDIVQVNGFNAFSYGQLSRTIGITTASIHYHFPTKEDLGEALARRYRERFNRILADIEAENSDPRKRIGKYAEQFLKTLERGHKICLCGMLASDYATLPNNVRSEVRLFFADNENWLAGVLKHGRESGHLVFASTPEDLAMTLLSTLEGAMLDSRVFEDETRLRRAIDCWQQVLLVGT